MRFNNGTQGYPQGFFGAENVLLSLTTGLHEAGHCKSIVGVFDNKKSRHLEVAEECEKNGIDTSKMPNMKNLHFVQIDEFYPINPNHHNSFHYYVNEY